MPTEISDTIKGFAIQEIAEQLGYHRATLYRELERNSCQYGYRPDWASQQALLRRRNRMVAKLDKNQKLKQFVLEKLEKGWSPQQISGRLNREAGRTIICHESLYQYIYSRQGQALKLFKYLRKKRCFRYPRIKRRRFNKFESQKNSIKERPAHIDSRETLGHWEGDLILFRRKKTNLFTLRERKTRLIVAIKNASRKARSTTNTLLNYMKRSQYKTIKSLTLDNGVAFSLHEEIAQNLKANVYFCEPYKSYQKGGIENANRLLRTKFPKRMDIDQIEQFEIDKIVNSLNDRPMKCLNYATPNEAFFKYFKRDPVLMGIRA
jgi:IS30 family transposase